MVTSAKGRALKAGLKGSRVVGGLFVVLGVAIVLLFINFSYTSNQSAHYREYSRLLGEAQVSSQQAATYSVEATSGNTWAFDSLDATLGNLRRSWQALTEGTAELPALSETLPEGAESAPLNSIRQQWQQLDQGIATILGNRQVIVTLQENSELLSELLPELQLEYEEIVDILQESNAPTAQVVVAQRQLLLAERIQNSIAKMRDGGVGATQAADVFGRDAALFGRVLEGQLNGGSGVQVSRISNGEARERLDKVASAFRNVTDSVNSILQGSQELQQVHEAVQQVLDASSGILKPATDLSAALDNEAGKLTRFIYGGYVLGALAVLVVILIGVLMLREARIRLEETDAMREETDAKNRQNQEAILRLLDEIGDLADGNLTVTATVSEDFTGAIADSINFSIDQLRDLVLTINNTAVRVATAAQETQSTAMNLSEASEHQAHEIAGVSAAISEMALSIDQVSSNATESAAVADRSVAIAKKGSEVVHNTIAGMDSIREQIQDTAKRIKRLGESSQEIGDIVSLINDIADQTNILALNAAIQASMAGDAGRGFAVVADEVQRLAERSSVATKQIESLVKAIQNDTNEAVISMEQTTSQVVRGARLTQDAGVALEDIERVSSSLAELIQNISNAARQQASSAGHISSTMNVIQNITAQTSTGTATTAYSIGNLATLAEEMRHSVSGFTLPSQDQA